MPTASSKARNGVVSSGLALAGRDRNRRNARVEVAIVFARPRLCGLALKNKARTA
jgi:hypothetical protein